MEKKVYAIQFEYDGEEYSIENLSYTDFTPDTSVNKNWMGMMIEDYIKMNNLSVEGAKATNARLIGNGDVCYKVDDFSKI